MEQTNINKLISRYLKDWPFFAIGVIIFLATAYLYIRYRAEPHYEISSTILVKTNDAGQGSLQNESIKRLGLIKNSTVVDDQIGILKSTGLMEKVVFNRSLNISFYIEGRIRDVEVYGEETPVQILADETATDVIYNLPIYLKITNDNKYELETEINAEKYKSEHNFGDLVDAPFGTFTVTRNERTNYIDNGKPLFFILRKTDIVIESYLSNLNIEQADLNSHLLNIRFKSNNKNKGEDVVAGLLETYVEEMIKYENELAENTIKMIDNRLKLLSGEIQGVEKSVEEFKTKNDLTDVTSNANIYIEQANEYQKLIADYQTEINVFDAIETYLLQGNLDTPIPASLSANDPSLTTMIDRYNETLLDKGQIAQSASKANPLIINFNRTLNELSKAIIENVRSARNRLRIAQRNLQSNANKYQAQIARVPSMERQLVDISRDKSTKEGLYLYLLQKREEEVLSLAAPVSSTRIVSLPKASRFPVSPNKTSLYLGGIILGLFLPLSILHIKDLLNNKVNNLDELSILSSTPLLGEIARSRREQINVKINSNRTPAEELFRLLCFNLDYLKKNSTNKTILVTSTIKGEGKTHIAANLAATFAANGERVVALSFDLRQPQLMKKFNFQDTPGITDFILNKEIDLNDILKNHPENKKLYLIGSGTSINQIGSLMLSKEIGVLLEKLKEKFDRIILDTPPIGMISDAFALNEYIDSTIYVVRKDVTKKEHLKIIDNINKNNKLRNTMILLNDTEAGSAYGYPTSNY
tara:strand:- start:60246 stop:62519 length:2274 start_codon:yes stop_codon:yes gene_type:complete